MKNRKKSMVLASFIFCFLHGEDQYKNQVIEMGCKELGKEKKTLYYVTGNQSKFKVLESLVSQDLSFTVEQVDFDLFEEQTEDQEKIALSKARQAWKQVQKPVLVDDAGIYFHKYKDFPGVFTKHVFKGIGLDGIAKLMEEGDVIEFRITAILMYSPDSYQIFTHSEIGTYKKIVGEARDKNAPFDDIFVPHGLDKTYCELRHHDTKLFYERFYRSVGMKKVLQFLIENDVL